MDQRGRRLCHVIAVRWFHLNVFHVFSHFWISWTMIDELTMTHQNHYCFFEREREHPHVPAINSRGYTMRDGQMINWSELSDYWVLTQREIYSRWCYSLYIVVAVQRKIDTGPKHNKNQKNGRENNKTTHEWQTSILLAFFRQLIHSISFKWISQSSWYMIE